MTAPPIPDDATLEREAVRLCRRYIDEVVLPFDFCPWAAPALRQQRVEIIALSQPVATLGPPLVQAARQGARALDRCWQRPELELVLLVYPRFRLARADFDALVRAVRDEAGARFVMAAFHPDATADTSHPERLVPFLRRSPDPMVQALRKDVLDRIEPGRGTGTAFVSLDRFLAGDVSAPPGPSPRERVARANLETVQRVGLRDVERALLAIHDDRRDTYAALGLEP
ncbi:MAG: DUF1415 domain-containing protein [Myxococcales bacterium]|nr:DUF1415 domain-containing protein [Myxococcales bacterium]